MSGDGTLWVRLVSWHVLAGPARTRCGRLATASEAVNDLPPNVKSCETCLRLITRDREKLA
jgi:hypothetical protein